jgi:phage-related protein
MPSQAALELLVTLKDQASSGLSTISGSLKTLGTIGLGVAAAGIAAVGATLVEGIGDAREATKIMAQTEAVIESTGHAAGVSAEHIADYASSLSAAAGKSLFGDDQIQQSENMLLTFTNIKDKVLDAATAISVDMAQALGGALKDNAIQLGKALNDPIAGITALTRVGVTFTEAQKKQIKTMQEAGNIAGAQQVILDELSKEFGGSAEAAAKADGGWAQFKDRMGETAETLGGLVLPLLNQLFGVLNDSVAPAIEATVGRIGDLISAFQVGAEGGDWIGGLVNALYSLEDVSPIFTQIGDGIVALADMTDPVNSFVEALSQVSPTFELLLGVTQETLPQILAIVTSVFSDIQAFWSENGDAMLGQAQATWQSIHDTIIALVPPIAEVVNAVLAQIAAFWEANGADILAFVGQTWTQINSIIQLAMQLIQATIVPALTAIAGFISSHGAEIQSILSSVWNAIKAIIDGALTLIQGIIKGALQLIQGDFSGAWQTIQATQERVGQDLIRIVQSFLQIIETIFSGAWQSLIASTEAGVGVIVGAVTELGNSIVSTLEALPGQMIAIGANIIGGIVQGVEGAAGQLYSKLEGIAHDALQAAKDALGISSPSDEFAKQVGEPVVLGIIQGMEAMLPGLASAVQEITTSMLNDTKGLADETVRLLKNMADDAQRIMEDLPDKVHGAIADAFDATASIDRQLSRNLDAVSKFGADLAASVQGELSEALTQAQQLQDPEQAEKYYKLRSNQILELAKLQEQYNKMLGPSEQGYDPAALDALQQRIDLIKQAQAAEIQAFGERSQIAPSGGPAGLAAQLQALLNSLSPGPDTSHAAGSLLGQLQTAVNQLKIEAGAIVIQAGPGQDPQAIAQAVMDEILKRAQGRF